MARKDKERKAGRQTKVRSMGKPSTTWKGWGALDGRQTRMRSKAKDYTEGIKGGITDRQRRDQRQGQAPLGKGQRRNPGLDRSL